jgi:hypothetical protein
VVEVVEVYETEVVAFDESPAVETYALFPTPLAHEVGAVFVFHATRYGATGDGSTDDRAAIQLALDAAGLMPRGGIVYLPEGTCIVGYGLQVPSNVRLKGAGMFATTVKLANNAVITDALRAQYLGNVISLWNVSTATVSDLTVDGNRANNTHTETTVANNLGSRMACIRIGGTAFTAERSVNCVVERVRAVNAACEGIEVAFATSCHVRQCYSADHGNEPWDTNAIILSIYCVDCHILECEGWRCVHGGLEIFGAMSAAPPQSVTIGCSIQRSKTDSIIVNPSGNTRTLFGGVVIKDNFVDTTGRVAVTGAPTSCHGIMVNGAADELTIEGNTILLGNGIGISVGPGPGVGPGNAGNPRHVVIRNNEIIRKDFTAESFSSGIQVVDIDNVLVEGNKVQGQLGGLWLQRCLGAIVKGNSFFAQYTGAEAFVATTDLASQQASGMHVTYHPRYGVLLYHCTRCVVSDNLIRGYAWYPIAEDVGTAAGSKPSSRNQVRGNMAYDVDINPAVGDVQAPTSTWSGNTIRQYL